MLLTAALFTAPISAAGETVKVSVSAKNKDGGDTIERGQEFTITVRLDDVPADGIAVLGFGIKYDPESVLIKDAAAIAEGPVSSGSGAWDREKAISGLTDIDNVFQPGLLETEGIVSVNWATGLGIADKAFYIHTSGVLCTIKAQFKINAASSLKSLDFKVVSPKKDSDVTFGVFKNDEDLTPYKYNFTAVEGKLNVNNDITSDEMPDAPAGWKNAYCDLDDDGQIKLADVIIVLQYCSGARGSYRKPDDSYGWKGWHKGMAHNADVYTDGNVDTKDLLLLLQKLLDSNVTVPVTPK